MRTSNVQRRTLNVEVKTFQFALFSMVSVAILGCTSSPTSEPSRQTTTESSEHQPDPGRDAMTSFLPVDPR
jgi:hypothetical protein